MSLLELHRPRPRPRPRHQYPSCLVQHSVPWYTTVPAKRSTISIPFSPATNPNPHSPSPQPNHPPIPTQHKNINSAQLPDSPHFLSNSATVPSSQEVRTEIHLSSPLIEETTVRYPIIPNLRLAINHRPSTAGTSNVTQPGTVNSFVATTIRAFSCPSLSPSSSSVVDWLSMTGSGVF